MFGFKKKDKDKREEVLQELTEEQKKIVDIFIENNKIACMENRAVCQDTGYVQVFISIGNNVHIYDKHGKEKGWIYMLGVLEHEILHICLQHL